MIRMVRWALVRNLSTLPPDPQQHIDRFQRDFVDAVVTALMGLAWSREQAAKELLGREYVCASCARGGQHLARRLRIGFNRHCALRTCVSGTSV